jgi:proline dehydrogenase
MILRSFLLFLSSHKGLRRWMETSPVAKRLTTRFIAGQTLDEALAVCGRLQSDGISITLDRLGESVNSPAEAKAACDGYIEMLHRIDQMGLNGTVSIKLTQLGLDISEETCRRNVERLVSEAKSLNRMVEIDMESSDYVDRTLGIVTDMWAGYGNVRSVIQAYLRRSEKDIDMMCEKQIPVRLCKGAYKEPATVAFKEKREVDASYVRLMKTLLERGNYPGLATHDEKIIEEAKRFTRERNISNDRFEFQMLYGIRRDLEKQDVAEGYRLRLYVPFGECWYPYFMRRLAERPANVLFLARNFLRG